MNRTDDPFDALRRQLETAHAADVKARSGKVKAAGRRQPTRVGLLVAVAALVTSTAVAATSHWSPILGGDNGAEPPSRITGDVPTAQAEVLEVLRRPQSDADRSPEVLNALRTVSSRFGSGLYVDGVRLLRRHARDNVLLLAFRRVGPQDDPGNQIADGLCVYTAEVAGTAPTTLGNGGDPLPTPISGASCGSLADVEHGRVAGLVPDGVARVRVERADGAATTVDVVNNYYETTPQTGSDPSATDDAAETTTWLDANGQPIAKTKQ